MSPISPQTREYATYSVTRVSTRRFTICREQPYTEEVVHVDVPHALIDVLANNMPRLLQLFRHWDRDHSGDISQPDFERALYALGVRYGQEQVVRLFRFLDADANNRVSLDELLLLKFAIDNHITSMPARPGLLDEGGDEEDDWGMMESVSDKHVELRIEDVDHVSPGSGLGFRFCNAVAKPMLGMVWKSTARPHHALALDEHLEHTRGPPAVHAPLRVCLRPELGPGFHVRLELVPLRGELQGERRRFVYQAGGDVNAKRFCEDMYIEIEEAAERAVGELQGLLGEVRQIDLKLEEVRLRQRGLQHTHRGEASARGLVRSASRLHSRENAHHEERSPHRELMRLKRVLRAIAADAEEGVIAHTRYTRQDYKPQNHAGGALVRTGRVVRFKSALLPDETTRRWLRLVAGASGLTLVVAAALQIVVQMVVWDPTFEANYMVCEFREFACRTRPWQYECTNGTVTLRSSAITLADGSNETCADVVPPLPWGEDLLDRPCSEALMARSLWLVLPLPPLLIATVLLPLALFRHNAHQIAIKKVLVWTPIVPLILVQCLVRAVVLLSIVRTAADHTYALLEGLVGLILVAQVAVFLLMDAMRYPAPALRIGLAFALLLRFGVSVIRRSTTELSAEQEPLFTGGTFAGLGSSPKQAIVCSIDWTVIAMLLSSIISVVQYPGEMAVVRLRCDIRRYFNWRDGYLGGMAVRAHRRDLDAADAVLWARSKFPVWLDRQAARVQNGLSVAKSFGTRTTTNLASVSTRLRNMSTAPGGPRSAKSRSMTAAAHSRASSKPNLESASASRAATPAPGQLAAGTSSIRSSRPSALGLPQWLSSKARCASASTSSTSIDNASLRGEGPRLNTGKI